MQGVLSAPFTQTVNLDGNKIARMKFMVNLPSKESVQVNLTFKLLSVSPILPEFNSSALPQPENLIVQSTSSSSSEEIGEFSTTTETTSTPLVETTSTFDSTITPSNQSFRTSRTDSETEKLAYRDSEPRLLTVEEAIEDFRQNLIMKELEIAGIFESEYPFYRHFKLEYENDVTVPIRCTYEAYYEDRKLQISCYEYRDFGSHRILANGEISDEPEPVMPAYIDVRSVKQTYTMSISR